MSSNNFVCRICGSLSPVAFTFSPFLEKTPLCVDDLGKFFSSHTLGSSVYPISAISFITSIADVPLYEETILRMAKCEAAIATLQRSEETEYRRGMLALQVAKESLISQVATEFDNALHRLTNLHETLCAQLILAIDEINAAKTRQGVELSDVTQAVVSRKELQKALCYEEFAKDFSRSVEKVVQMGVKFPLEDVKEYLLRGFKGKNERKRQGEIKAEPQPAKKQELQISGTKAAQNRCLLCAAVLKPQNFITLPDHSNCLACFKCIKSNTQIHLSCPICKSGYSEHSKQTLLSRISGLNAKLSDNNSKASKEKCDQCGSDCFSERRHRCVGGQSRCLQCHQRLVAKHCYGEKIVCPVCKAVPVEIYTNLKMLECGECARQVRLNEVRHWCEKGLVCAHCYAQCRCVEQREVQYY